MDYLIRPLSAADEPLLWEMLYQALHTSEGAPPRDILQKPEFARYVERWGRVDDTGFLAYDAKQNTRMLGAVWLRGSKAEPGAESIPELAFSVNADVRRRGIGAALLTQLVKANPHHSSIIIHAATNNPAVRLYERFGFKVVAEAPHSVTMRR